jgi:N,N'-diacetyllegionaminate synthase
MHPAAEAGRILTRVLVIAEAGVNHNGDIDRAVALVDAAADAGADVVKFQTFRADKLVTPSAPKAEYQKRATELGGPESQHAMLRKLELNVAAHERLIARAREKGIEFLSTGFDLESLELLRSLAMQRMKVPSGEITNLPYLRQVAGFGKPVILSTGMASIEEIGTAVEVLEAGGIPRSAMTILHCTTAYPTPMQSVNLRAMQTLATTFDCAVGYSDHTEGIEVSIAAVAMGAVVVEKHFTLDRSLPGPDHRASIEPDELRRMVEAIRNIELALGDGIKRVAAAESENMAIARKSLVAARAIRAGEAFSPDNMTVKRPGTGLSPMRWDDVVGMKARRDFAPDELIEL